MALHDNRFTIFDVLEKKGYFRHNPANAGATDPITREVIYKGPIEFPKMLYHPEGKTEEVLLGDQFQNTPFGPIHTNTHHRLIHKIVNSKEEEAAALAEGWHDKPWKAMKAGGADTTKIEAAQAAAPMAQDAKDDYIRRLEAALANAGVTINGNHIEDVNKLLAETRPTEELMEAASANPIAADLRAKGLIEDDE